MRSNLHLWIHSLLLCGLLLACDSAAPTAPTLGQQDGPDAGLSPDSGQDHLTDPDAQAPACTQDLDCDDGVYCNGVERCQGGQCVAPTRVPCDDDIGCTVDTCDEERDTCVFTPDHEVCGPGRGCDPKAGCFGDPECQRDADCDDGLFCNGVETCHPRDGLCVPGQAPACQDGVACTADTCDEDRDACQHSPQHALCDTGELCDPEQGCADAPACQQDGDCDDGLFCNGAEVCAQGQCQPGEAPALDDGVACTADTCDEDQDVVLHLPQDAACDDGLFCDGVEVCHPQAGCQPGALPALDDGLRCTLDRCDEARDLVEHLPNHAACDDGLFCNGAEVCDLALGCQAGAPPALDDGLLCTADRCDEAQDQVLHEPLHGRCDDGLFCNGAEVCDAALGCLPGAPPVIDDGVACTADNCDEATDTVTHTSRDGACDDGLFCNGAETCDATLGCLPGAPPVIDDGVACTADTCDEAADAVLHLPQDSACDDDLSCNGAETCDPALGCQPGDAPLIDDGVACTLDTCDDDTGEVAHLPQHGRCDDGLFCNGAETCDAALGCLPGAPPVIDDGVACTADSCDEDTDAVTHTSRDGACDDGLFCNGAETCDAALGCLPGAPPMIDDGVTCTADTCDEAADAVLHLPQDGACDDGLYCNGAETCDAARGCLPGAAPVVSDGLSCTVDSCDEANDRSLHAPQDGRCDDGDACTVDRCDADLGCASAPVVDCLADGCCPQGCDANSDPDCGAVCGNGVVESGESCEQDGDCAQGALCQGCACVESCQDEVDNDGDGAVDCQDEDCRGRVGCGLLLPFEALTANDQGIAAWNINGTGPEPRRQGHALPAPLNRCGGAVTYYFLSSPSYAGPQPDAPPLDPDANGTALAVEPTQGVWALLGALEQHNIPLSELHFNFGLMSLGEDLEGQDWWIQDTTETRRYAGGTLQFTLNGAPLIEGPMPTIELEIQYNDPGNCADEQIAATSQPLDLGAFVDISHGQPAPVRAVAQALLQDLRQAGQVRLTAATLQPAQQLEFSVNGRRGAYYDAPIMQLEALPVP